MDHNLLLSTLTPKTIIRERDEIRFTFGILLLSVVNCQDSKGNYKVEVEKLIEAIQGSSLLKVGLSGTVARL